MAVNGLKLSEGLISLGIMGEQLRASLESPVHHNSISMRGLRGGGLNWSPIMPRDVSLSDRQCEISQIIVDDQPGFAIDGFDLVFIPNILYHFHIYYLILPNIYITWICFIMACQSFHSSYINIIRYIFIKDFRYVWNII